jgi:hypothetical protein
MTCLCRHTSLPCVRDASLFTGFSSLTAKASRHAHALIYRPHACDVHLLSRSVDPHLLSFMTNQCPHMSVPARESRLLSLGLHRSPVKFLTNQCLHVSIPTRETALTGFTSLTAKVSYKPMPVHVVPRVRRAPVSTDSNFSSQSVTARPCLHTSFP